jgi:hypothetical protein
MGGLIVFLVSAFVIAIAYQNGYTNAHSTVATECERLGAFYVGDKTYKCELKK